MKPLIHLKSRILAPFTRKVFCIGHNKTGTTTVESVLKQAGYLLPKQKEQEKQLVESLFHGNSQKIRRFCHFYTAFQDLPFSMGDVYIAADVLFPGSKFILTIRDPEDWFSSLERFHLKVLFEQIGLNDPSLLEGDMLQGKDLYLHENYVYNVMKRIAGTVSDDMSLSFDWSRVYDREKRKLEFMERNKRIVSYFQDRPNDLLVIDISKEVDNRKIIDFLELNDKFIEPLPHLNSSRL